MDQKIDTPKKAIPKSLILLTVIIGTFLGRLDQTIVNLALPDMIDEFGITVSAAGWIATAYILANAVFVPIWGKLGDRMGRKKIYMWGFSLFIVGSILAGLAWNLSSMIVFRILQAIAGSADYPTAMSILAVTYTDPKERAQALGIWSASFAAAAVFGPLIGGPLIDYFNWRSVFLINLPVGLVGLWMAMVYIEESKSDVETKEFDVWGAVTLGIALSAVVLVLDKGIEWGWMSPESMAAYGVTLLMGSVFYMIEKHHPDPIVDLRFFRIPVFVQALLNNFIVFMGMMGSIFLVPVFAQTFLGFNATQTGYVFMPMAAGMMLGAPLGGKIASKMQPKYVIFISTLLAALGLYLFSYLDPRSGISDIIIPLFIMAFGMGFGMAQRTNIIAAAVEPHEIGVASSVLALARNIAGAFGIAFFGTLLNSSVENNVLHIAQMSTIRAMDYVGSYVPLITLKAQIDGYHTVFIAASVVLVIGAVLILFMENVQLEEGQQVHVE